MEETVDIVDENDEFLFKELANNAHHKNLIHRTVNGVLINDNKEIFIVRKSLKNEKFPWLIDCSISSHVKSSQSYDETILREWENQLGIVNWEYKLITKKLYNFFKYKHYCTIYIIKYSWEIKLNKNEFEDGYREKYENIINIPENKTTNDFQLTMQIIKNCIL